MAELQYVDAVLHRWHKINFATIAICESSSYHVARKMLSFKIFVIPVNIYADHEQLYIDMDKEDGHICY